MHKNGTFSAAGPSPWSCHTPPKVSTTRGGRGSSYAELRRFRFFRETAATKTVGFREHLRGVDGGASGRGACGGRAQIVRRVEFFGALVARNRNKQ